MGNKQKSLKKSYYKLFKQELKNSYDTIQISDYNRDYSLQMHKFKDKKSIKQITDSDNINWKTFLLEQLYKKTSGWKRDLYDYISNNFDIKNEDIYNYENKIFIQQFVLLSFPQIHLGDEESKEAPILSLFSNEELKEYSSHQKTKKNKGKKEINSFLSVGTSSKEELTIDSKDLSDIKIKGKYNSYKIREHLNIIQRQLIEERHPINAIIKQFSNFYKEYINDFLKIIKPNKTQKIEKMKHDVIKDIQTFIEITSVALKLFYLKTINYEFFVSERDEFFNLICSVLFYNLDCLKNNFKNIIINEKGFYESIYELFKLSNQQKTKDLTDKIKKFGEIYPKDVGISIKFCLDDTTKDFRNKKEYNKNQPNSEIKKKKSGIVDYFEKIDFLLERMNSFTKDKISMDIDNITESDDIKRNYTGFASNVQELSKNNSNIKEEKTIERTSTIMSYKDFSEKINSPNTTLIEKYKEDMNDNPSHLDIPSIEDTDNELNIPYGEVVKYIQKINEYHVPLDKLTIIALSSVLITDCVDNFWGGVKDLPEKFLNIDADELMSIYLYIIYNIIYNNKIDSIYTQLDFINFFTGNTTKKSIIGYYYTTIEGCINFITSVKRKEDLAYNGDNVI